MSERSFRATGEQPARRLGGATGRGFLPGRSGNPARRPKGLEALAREHTAEAIAALVAALKRPKEAVPAAIALLDRGWGRPKQTCEADTSTSPVLLHLLAAQQASAEIAAAFERRNTIEGRAETTNGNAPTTPADLLIAPIPTE